MLDLFSGIGGFSLAARWTWGDNLDIVGFCEIDEFCQKELSKNFSGVPIYDDIKKLKGSQFGTVDIVTGGDPCQPHSLAGKRKGKKDDRYLWPEMFRIIQETQPDWIINENVIGSISNRVVDRKCDDLESEGYACQAYNLPAFTVGAPHKRERIWIVAHNESKINGKHYTEKSNGQIQQLGISVKPTDVPNADKLNDDISRFRASEVSQFKASQIFNNNVADTTRRIVPSRGSGSKIVTQEKEIRKTARVGCSCFNKRQRNKNANWWAVEPDVGRVAHGIPNRVDRLKGLGNAIVPQVAAVIMKAIKEVNEVDQNELKINANKDQASTKLSGM